jgi:hypothetical protein
VLPACRGPPGRVALSSARPAGLLGRVRSCGGTRWRCSCPARFHTRRPRSRTGSSHPAAQIKIVFNRDGYLLCHPRCQAAIGYQQNTRSTVMRRQSQCHPASVAWQPVNCGPLGGHHGRSAAGIKEPNREATATGLKPYRARPRYLWHRQMPTPGDLQPLPATQRTRLLTVSPSIAADQSPLDWLCNLCQGGRDGPKGHNRDDG